MYTVTQAELVEAIDSGNVVVVDALPAAAFSNRHLPGSVNLTIEEIAEAASRLPDQAAAIVVHSTDTSCSRAPELAAALSTAGYRDVRIYADGIADWAEAGLPLESGFNN
jgi:rhodanese-related sulfurtransferase